MLCIKQIGSINRLGKRLNARAKIVRNPDDFMGTNESNTPNKLKMKWLHYMAKK